MVSKSDWLQMKQHAFDAFARDGMMSVEVLEQIVDIALLMVNLISRRKLC